MDSIGSVCSKLEVQGTEYECACQKCCAPNIGRRKRNREIEQETPRSDQIVGNDQNIGRLGMEETASETSSN